MPCDEAYCEAFCGAFCNMTQGLETTLSTLAATGNDSAVALLLSALERFQELAAAVVAKRQCPFFQADQYVRPLSLWIAADAIVASRGQLLGQMLGQERAVRIPACGSG